MNITAVTSRLPRWFVCAGVESVVRWQARTNNNQFRYVWDGHEFVFVYPNARAFAYLRQAINTANGTTGREEVPLSYLELPDHVDGIIDGGAHFGIYTVLLGVLNRSNPLIAYEPSSYNARILRGNVRANDLQNVEHRQKVLNVDGTETQLVQPTPTRIGNRFYENTIGYSIHLDANESSGGETTIAGDQLSSVIAEKEWSNPFVKLDIEGAEHEVVSDLLDTNFDTLQGIVELHPDRIPEDNFAHEILFWFEQNGFEFECVKDRNPARAAYWFSNA